MQLLRHFRIWLTPLVVASLLATGLPSQAQERVRAARLNHLEGTLAFSPASDNEWLDKAPRRALVRGDRLWLDPAARAELQLGGAMLRMAGPSQLTVAAIDARTVQLNLTRGPAHAHVTELRSGDNFELDTPNLAFRATQPGVYRLDVDPSRAETRVSVREGSGVVYGQGGQALTLTAGQQATFGGRALAQVATAPASLDRFDQWVAGRARLEVTARVDAAATPEARRSQPPLAQAQRAAAAPGQAALPATANAMPVRRKSTQAPASRTGAVAMSEEEREAWQKEQQALTDRWRREHYAMQERMQQRQQQDGIPILRQR